MLNPLSTYIKFSALTFSMASCVLWVTAVPSLAQSVQSTGKHKIVFEGKGQTEDDNDIYTMNQDGSEIVNLTSDDADERSPVWSPDGKHIAYVVVEPTPPISSIAHGATVDIDRVADIWVMNADGSQQRKLTDNAGKSIAATTPCWSNDGRTIAFTVDNFAKGELTSFNIFIMDLNGGNLTKLRQGSNPVWSPDSKRILYTSGNPSIGIENVQLCVMDVNGTNSHVLAESAALGSWSPDGRRIVYNSVGVAKEKSAIFIMKADGSGKRRLSATADSELGPEWSQDGKRIFFTLVSPDKKTKTTLSPLSMLWTRMVKTGSS